MLHLDDPARVGRPEAQHDGAVADGRHARALRRGDAHAEAAAAYVETFGENALGGRHHLDRLAHLAARGRAPRQRIGAVALHLRAQQRVGARGRREALVHAGAVVRLHGAYHGVLALHDEGDVLVVEHHFVHRALHRVEPQHVAHEVVARAFGLRAVAGQEFEHGGVGREHQQHEEEQQGERYESSENACGRDVDVPLLAAVGGVAQTEPPLAQRLVPAVG